MPSPVRSPYEGAFVAMAHRGGALYPANVGRENTLHAFSEAVALGYRFLETDVHATRDARLVAFHDERLDRVSDTVGAIADLDFATVRAARVGGLDQVPTLEELLDAFPSATFNIDIKADAAVEPLARVLQAHRAEGRVCVGSFRTARLHAFRRRTADRVPTSASPAGLFWASQVPLLPRWLPAHGVACQTPLTHRVQVGPIGISLRMFGPRLIRHAHAAGRQVHVWTIDDAEVMNNVIDQGADGIVADRIDVLKDVLLARGLWT